MAVLQDKQKRECQLDWDGSGGVEDDGQASQQSHSFPESFMRQANGA